MIDGREAPIRTLHGYASGRDGDWEAICLDLDIAVQGSSFEEVARSLRDAVTLYLESVGSLPETQQAHLLHRTAPLGHFTESAQRKTRSSSGWNDCEAIITICYTESTLMPFHEKGIKQTTFTRPKYFFITLSKKDSCSRENTSQLLMCKRS